MAIEGGRGGSSRRKRVKKVLALSYPSHLPRPEDLLDFIELRPFTRRWDGLGLDDELDLSQLQLEIMANPKKGDVVAGTGGIRKLRFAREHGNKGKSGAFRVLYVYFEEFGIVLLCMVYRKGEVDEISQGVKATLRKTVHEIELELTRLKTIR